ncbi:MAG: hypothetical protein JJLCMIEE_03081 [Acidimicrobiales bacterium]|nr:MAG: hypothetical protein EDR02_08025 [Actinomycetota bacterium]MBV6509963.1 hypothetical protein [Acidimicrobiales bacterium]RIK08549.1 MAG: hypothetical protein DCC48_00980 [Acidobacteriota bacterium]
MDLEFGHGFIPRIGEENYKAVDRCIGPADLFSEDPLECPWVIVDGAWAEGRPELLDTLKANGTKLVIDTFGWRYRYDATAEVKKLVGSSWAPAGALSIADGQQVRELVESSLNAQAILGAAAYLLPGWMPEDDAEDLRSAYEVIFEVAADLRDVPARPFVAFIGGHTRGVDQVLALLDEVPHFVSAVYVQLSPINPAADSPSKLESLADVYQHASGLGFKVIAGHAGAITPAMRALGIDAADAGLATNETFDRARVRRSQGRANHDSSQGGGRRSRMYFSQLGRSLSADDVERLLSVPAGAAELRGCRMPCHRFRSDHIIERAREHSLWARVQDAQLVSSLPPSMRLTSLYERLRTQRSTISTINSALTHANLEPLDMKSIDNHLAWIARALSSRSAA